MRSVENIFTPNCKNSCRGIAILLTRFIFFFVIFFLFFSSSELQAQTGTIAVNDNNVCEDDASPIITFTGNGGTAEYTFTYTINDGAPITTGVSAGNTITITVPTGTAGNFDYELISVQDNNGTGASVPIANEDVTINVQAAPTPNIFINNGVIPLCYNGTTSVELRSDEGGMGYSYQWYVTGFPPGPGTPIPGANGRNYTTNSSGYYSVLVTNPAGCSSYSPAFQVTQMFTPGAIYGEHDQVHDSRCINYNPPTLQLVNIQGGAAPLTYQWQSS